MRPEGFLPPSKPPAGPAPPRRPVCAPRALSSVVPQQTAFDDKDNHMTLRSLLAALRGRRARCRPRLEPLEDRALPSFTPFASLPVGSNPQAIVTADFNGDHRLDLAVANVTSNDVSILLANG